MASVLWQKSEIKLFHKISSVVRENVREIIRKYGVNSDKT